MNNKDLGSLLKLAQSQKEGIVRRLVDGRKPDYTKFNDTIIGILAFVSDRNVSLNLFVRHTPGESDTLILGVNYGNFHFSIPWEVLETVAPEKILSGVKFRMNTQFVVIWTAENTMTELLVEKYGQGNVHFVNWGKTPEEQLEQLLQLDADFATGEYREVALLPSRDLSPDAISAFKERTIEFPSEVHWTFLASDSNVS